jgi:KTSC domain
MAREAIEMKAPSECIASLAYDADEGLVYFTFVRGVKEYSAPMSRQQVTAWAYSDSPGVYFNENIKGKYGF